MTYATWSFDSIRISGQPQASILWLYKASRSLEGIRDELPMTELGNGRFKREAETYHSLGFWLFSLRLIVWYFVFSS